LRLQGLVRQGERDGQYYLTFEVRRLSEGFEDETWVGPGGHTGDACVGARTGLAVRLATAEAGFMVVRESTHRWSALSQHRAMIGEKMPMLVTAVGRAYLTACDDTEREAVLELLGARSDQWGELARDKRAVRRHHHRHT
jgi:IclR family mhp operon transcriptional activator